jgi:CRISPR-associated protein Csm1
MNPQTVQATFGCLLHDVGKAVYRAGISDGRHGEAGYRFVRDIDGYGQAKAVLDCIRYHHAAQLRQAKDCDPLAAIACIADNIAAAADQAPDCHAATGRTYTTFLRFSSALP